MPVADFLVENYSITTLINNAAFLKLGHEGRIECEACPKKPAGRIRVCGGRLLDIADRGKVHEIIDLAKGEKLLTLPQKTLRVIGNRILTYDGKTLSFYALNDTEPQWAVQAPISERDVDKCAVSLDRSQIALGAGSQGDTLLHVYSSEDGRILSRIQRSSDSRHQYVESIAFNQDGTRVATILRGAMRVYDLRDGRLVLEEQSKEQFFRHVLSAGNQWILVRDEKNDVFYNEERGFGPTIPLSDTKNAILITALGKEAVLLESDRQGVLVDPSTGKVLTKWAMGKHRRYRDAAASPLCSLAFDGNVLVRSIGAATIELVSLGNLKTIVTVHCAPVKDQMEWIAYTPDGYWSATEEAVSLVAVTKNGKLASAEECLSRYNPSVIESRIQKAASGSLEFDNE